jgi:hypothetical protein
MVGIITGDIVASRRQKNPELWLNPLKALFGGIGQELESWEIFRGDSFQLEISDTADVLWVAYKIKALLKSLGGLDVRMAIGLGNISYAAKRLSESNGTAFIHSGEKFETLKQEKIKLALKSADNDFDKTFNLLLKFASISMDNWTATSAHTVFTFLEFPDATQTEIGQRLQIKQHTVSERLQRSRMAELLELNTLYREQVKKLKP